HVVKEVIDSIATIECNPHTTKPDITKANNLLRWEPKMSLRQGLRCMGALLP
uniref:UDP-glucuronate decarboxylase n=1 Tax=Physcomitrium patens TaxID=3218 RepID=A0A7I3YVI4_PHYPA